MEQSSYQVAEWIPCMHKDTSIIPCMREDSSMRILGYTRHGVLSPSSSAPSNTKSDPTTKFKFRGCRDSAVGKVFAQTYGKLIYV